MNKVQAYILHKESEKFNSCDDNFNFNEEKLNFAVCDGSSSDFFSKIYSRILSDEYSEKGGEMFTPEKISDLNAQWREKVKEEIEEAGCRPGSFPFVHYQRRDPGCSTFVCLSFHKDETCPTFDFYVLGDSVIFFIPRGEYKPELQISSDSIDDYSFNPDVHFGYTPPIASSYCTEWIDLMKKEIGMPLREGTFVMVTDAVAEWLLRNDDVSPEDKFKEILTIDSQKEFESYVKAIRNKGAHMDDMTLVIISIDDINELEFSQENIDKYDYRTIAQEQSKKANPLEPTVDSLEPTVDSPEPTVNPPEPTADSLEPTMNPQEQETVQKEPVDEYKEQIEDLQEKVKELNIIIEQLQKENENLQNLNKKKIKTDNLNQKKKRSRQKKQKKS